jgi:3-deoxy-D-arabino-heptulosonate 7-phosphate (DAHP) synthase
MSVATTGSTAAAVAAMIQATKASGVIVKVDPEGFMTIVRRQDKPLIVHARGGLLKPNYQYLTSYKGLAFFTKSSVELDMPYGVEFITAKTIWVPDY